MYLTPMHQFENHHCHECVLTGACMQIQESRVQYIYI